LKKVGCALCIVLVGCLAWMAAGTRKELVADATPPPPVTKGASPIAPPAGSLPVEPMVPETGSSRTTEGSTSVEPAPLPTVTAAPGLVPEANPGADPFGSQGRLLIPVTGYRAASLRDMFNEVRGDRRHEAIDLMAPRGTAVIAADDGVVKKLFTSKPGGLTVYQFDPSETYCYYYAHLDGYAVGLHEGQLLRRGELVGYVGTTGNAPKDAPHLHFAVIRLDPDKKWWKGTYVDPYPLFARAP
jgi:murein DD-endopeptidase MepM/ murein hydrolase activator NlpD